MIRLDLILVGFGNVGRRFVRLLDELRPALQRDRGLDTRVVAIATRSLGQAHRSSGLDAAALATDAAAGRSLGPRGTTRAFLRNALEQNAAAARDGRLVVVETTTLDIATGQPAIGHVRTALAGGAHVVTANKGPAAFAYERLKAAARRAGRCFLFESAVMDGVPLFNLAREGLPGVSVTGFRGVVNATTQHILTAMERGESFDAALTAMQQAGVAEADPSLDVEGWDAAAKTAALANVLLGGRLTPRTIDREGVSAKAVERVRAAKSAGRRLKLVASAEKAGSTVSARVGLTELPVTDVLGSLEGQQNALVLRTDLLGEIAIVQRGSGLTLTAYGLVSDLVSISQEVRRMRATRPGRGGARRDRSRATPARR